MLTWNAVEMQREHVKDLRQEAAIEHLLRQAHPGRPTPIRQAFAHLRAHLAGWMADLRIRRLLVPSNSPLRPA